MISRKASFYLSVLIAFGGVLLAQNRGVYRQSGPHLRFSIETGQARRGWTPVQVSLAGTEISVRMDVRGWVFPATPRSMRAGMDPLFTIDPERGTIELDGVAYEIQTYERNPVRTRFWIKMEAVDLPLELDEAGGAGTLQLGRLAIPAMMIAAGNGHWRGETTPPAGGDPAIPRRNAGQATAQLLPERIRMGDAENR